MLQRRVTTGLGFEEMWVAAAGESGYVRPGIADGAFNNMPFPARAALSGLENINENINDAEMHLYRAAYEQGSTINALGATRPVCTSCQERLPDEVHGIGKFVFWDGLSYLAIERLARLPCEAGLTSHKNIMRPLYVLYGSIIRSIPDSKVVTQCAKSAPRLEYRSFRLRQAGHNGQRFREGCRRRATRILPDNDIQAEISTSPIPWLATCPGTSSRTGGSDEWSIRFSSTVSTCRKPTATIPAPGHAGIPGQKGQFAEGAIPAGNALVHNFRKTCQIGFMITKTLFLT
jgi:hypothetical protein